MHLQKRFQSLGNGCQRSFLFPSTLNALCVCVCILTTVLYYYALSTTSNRKSSHKWRRRRRRRERERGKSLYHPAWPYKELLLKNPWRSLFGGSWTLSNNANRWIRISLQPTSVVALAKRIISFVSLTRAETTPTRSAFKGCFSMPTWKEPWFLRPMKKLIQTEFITLSLPESRADFFTLIS